MSSNGPSFYMNNNVFYKNLAEFGGAIYVEFSILDVWNSICWADSAAYGNEIYDYDQGCVFTSYCDIEGNHSPGHNNIDTDPLFRDPENGDFHLMSTACGDSLDSPCIDAGDPTIFDYQLDCDWGLGTERSDMGAYGGQAIPTGIDDRGREIELPVRLCVSQNYPNPFNSSTIISYSLPSESHVTISIYNVLGRLEEILLDGSQRPGRQTVSWDATGYSSGIYFARIDAGERTGNIRMVLVK